MHKRFFIVGGAGFIGSHFTHYLLSQSEIEKVSIYDNFSSGKLWHLEPHTEDSRVNIVRDDVKNQDALTKAMKNHDVVIHLASNPDIARAATEPSIDFYEGTLLTHHVVESMRINGVQNILYASGSGVYGEVGSKVCIEDQGDLIPISTYGASKLAGEALIASYCYMFGLRGCAFRFANVVGPRQTHGVGYDFLRKLRKNPKTLEILGDGNQSKSYIYIEDIIRGVLLALEKSEKPFDVFNIGTGDAITVREIADLALQALEMDRTQTTYEFTGGDRGWKGDVPIVRLSIEKIESLGWKCTKSSKEAIQASLSAMKRDLDSGQIKRQMEKHREQESSLL